MLVARNQNNKMVKILDSIESDTYYCPICKEQLTRSFGLQRQFFNHPKEKGNNCELKIKLMLKNESTEFEESEVEILKREYFDKTFDDVKTEMSDYISEEGYPLTQQQKEIINSTEDKIKISALAGSSKSTTLYYYSKERPFKKILYLVYNKSMKDEAELMFGKLRNVQIKTTHGLAYAYVGKYYKNKLTFNYNAVDTLKDLGLSWNEQETAIKVYNMFKEFTLSNKTTFSELDMYKDDKNRDYYITLSNKLWEFKKDFKNDVKVEHDFYLKLFHLSVPDLSDKFDTILLDEAQDSNDLVLDILNKSNVENIVMVGDALQQLYGWRNSKNVLSKFEAKEYKLTTSFRVSQNIANICNLIIKDVNDMDIDMKGFNTKQKIVNKIDKSKPYVCLCRTNSSIFGEVIEAIESGKKGLYFIGGYSGYNFNNILDCYYFSQGHKVKNHLFNKFDNYVQMETYAEKNEDIELLSLIRMVTNYGSRIPDLIEKIKKYSIGDKDKADMIISTIHKSKGSTFKLPVYISNDHFDIDIFFNKKFIECNYKWLDEKDFYEEMCILYVAITRCAGDIQLSDTLKEYLIMRYKYFN